MIGANGFDDSDVNPSIVSAEDLKEMIVKETNLSRRLDNLERVTFASNFATLQQILNKHDEAHKKRCQSSQDQLDQLVVLTSQLSKLLENIE